ncbi:hypothetical protein BJX68DRAFT_64507 [Aspergillus pseudodeflectus]|uniref:Uncharacterized protein n=1 Tax=Aspergillus pseudodeflectus TaxID=176178 RepID=A0ABR4KJ77_9EURO
MLANIAAGAAVILGYHLSQTKPKRSGWETLLPTSWVEERKRGIIPSSLSLMDVLWIAPLCVLMYWAAESIATHYGHDLVFRDINRTLRELTEDVQTEATNTENGVSGNSSSPDSPVDKSCEMAKTLRQSGQSEIQHSRQRPGKSAEPNEAKEAASIAGQSIQKNETRPNSSLEKRQSEGQAQARAQEQAGARSQEQVELEVEAEVYYHTIHRPRYNGHRRAQSHFQDHVQHHNVHGDFAHRAHRAHQQHRNNYHQAHFPAPFIAFMPVNPFHGHAHCSPERCPLWCPRCRL